MNGQCAVAVMGARGREGGGSKLSSALLAKQEQASRLDTKEWEITTSASSIPHPNIIYVYFKARVKNGTRTGQHGFGQVWTGRVAEPLCTIWRTTHDGWLGCPCRPCNAPHDHITPSLMRGRLIRNPRNRNTGQRNSRQQLSVHGDFRPITCDT
jgi:hypothetical protein